ncbi:hypothetical protein CHISP_3709 [Chitinispirillum alkaliphilum]|nr:hypothetical protein CHISP_3709 [Chitinispirillum alkaliphilum]
MGKTVNDCAPLFPKTQALFQSMVDQFDNSIGSLDKIEPIRMTCEIKGSGIL